MGFEIRRHNQIIAFKNAGFEPVALHAHNLEVAEISEELWRWMPKVNWSQSGQVAGVMNSPVGLELEAWNQELDPLTEDQFTPPGIRRITLNMTQICNLHCNYCAAGGDGSYGDPITRISIERTIPQLRFLIDKIPEGGAFHITFLGGEPLLYPQGIALIGSYVQEKCKQGKITPSFSITTNGTLLSEENVRILENLQCNITISVDGPGEINDRVRPQKNGESGTLSLLEGLESLAARRKSGAFWGRIGLHGVFSEENMEIKKAYEFYSSLPVDSFEFTYGVTSSDPELSYQYMAQMEEVAALAFAKGRAQELCRIGNFAGFYAALENQIRISNHCGIGKNFLMIDSRNRFFTCPWEVGNNEEMVGQDTFLDKNKLDDYKESLIERNHCHSCWARFLCGGGCNYIHKAKTKLRGQKDTHFCERTRHLVALTVHYFRLQKQHETREEKYEEHTNSN